MKKKFELIKSFNYLFKKNSEVRVISGQDKKRSSWYVKYRYKEFWKYKNWNIIMQIPFHKTHSSEEEINAVVDAVKSGWLTMGPKTIEFENRFKEYIGSKESISMNSATAALHLALKAIGIKKEMK